VLANGVLALFEKRSRHGHGGDDEGLSLALLSAEWNPNPKYAWTIALRDGVV
jgi:hypothetical protein